MLLITDRWRPDFLSQVQYHWKHGKQSMWARDKHFLGRDAFKRSFIKCAKTELSCKLININHFMAVIQWCLSHSNRVSLQFFYFIYYPAITHFIGELATKVCGPSIDKGINKVSLFPARLLSCSKGHFHPKIFLVCSFWNWLTEL